MIQDQHGPAVVGALQDANIAGKAGPLQGRLWVDHGRPSIAWASSGSKPAATYDFQTLGASQGRGSTGTTTHLAPPGAEVTSDWMNPAPGYIVHVFL